MAEPAARINEGNVAAVYDRRQLSVRVNGKNVSVAAGTIVAAAIAEAGVTRFRTSVTGLPRGPLCGMGICMECCVTINGRAHCRSCQTLCEEGMEVRTEE